MKAEYHFQVRELDAGPGFRRFTVSERAVIIGDVTVPRADQRGEGLAVLLGYMLASHIEKEGGL